MNATGRQLEALQKIHAAGGSMEYYWYPARGRKVEINGNCASALQKAGLIETGWLSPKREGESVMVATLTAAGREQLAAKSV